jgi:hypothetical protein
LVAKAGEFVFRQGLQQHLDGRQADASRQHARLPPRGAWLEGHQPCPGLASLGHHDGFAGMGGIDQARKVGFGLVHVHGAVRFMHPAHASG